MAKSTTWTGGASTSWSDPANWSNGVPVAGDDVTIQNATNAPLLDSDISLGSLNLSNNSTFTIASGVNLDVTGAFSDANNGSSTLNVNNGNLTLNSTTNIFGSINLGSGTIDFLGDFTLSGILDVVDGTVNVGTSMTSAVFEIKRGGEFNLNNGTLNVYGASTIKGSGALNVTGGAVNFYGTSTYNGQGILNAGSGDIYFAKDVTISGNGTINAENSTIIMDGSTWDMADNASNFNPGTSTVIFSGDAQLITGSNKQDITFYNLTIDPGANVTADIPVTVTNNYVNNGTFGPTPPNLSSSAAITQQPVSQEVCEGASVSFSVGATGATGYQWQKNGVDISGATSSVLTISNASQSDAAQYVCYVYGGGYVKSDGAVLSVNSLPSVSLSASSNSVCDGSDVILTATNSGGNASTVSRSNFPNIDIPDDNTAGISSTISLPAGSSIPSSADLIVSITMEHSWVGDLKVTLTGPGGSSGVGETTIFDQPGVPASTWGNDQQLTSNGSYVFTTAATKVIPEVSDGSTILAPGEYLPSNSSGASNSFSGINFPVSNASGTWTLKVYDLAWWFTGKLIGWSITVKYNGKYTTYFSGPGTIGTVSYSGANQEVATADVTPPSAPGNYTYVATTSTPTGCSATDTARVHVMDAPQYTPSPDTTICSGSTAHLRVTLPADSAMQFNGSSSYIGIANSPDINTYSSSSILKNRTVALWFKANDVNARQVLYEEGAGYNGFSIYIDGGYLYVHGWEDQITWTTTPIKTNISTNKWYNAAFVYNADAPDGEYLKGYLNGKYIGSASANPASDGMNPHSGDINIGRSDGIRFPDGSTHSGNYFSGEIDEFKLWNRSLSTDEIFSEQFNHTVTSNEIVYYNFNGDSGSNIVDATGGTNATSNGATHTTDAPFRPTVSWSPGGGAGTTNDVSPTANTTYTYTLTEPLVGCATTGNINVTVNPEVGTPVFADGPTSTRCQGAGTITYTATASDAIAITYSLDATSESYGNTINASTGDVTYASGWSGTSTITVTAEGCGGPKTATHTVTTTPSVGVPTPITVSAGSEPACPPETGTLTTTYSSTATNSTGLVWSIDDPSAGSINSSTGEMTWAQGFSGTVNIKVEAAGCNGPTFTSRTVTVIDNEPPAFDPAFTYGNLTECATDELSQQATLTLALPVANTDNCGTPTLSYSVAGTTTVNSTVVTGPTVNVTFNEGLSTVTYTLDDGNGKTSTLSFTVTIEHKPELTGIY